MPILKNLKLDQAMMLVFTVCFLSNILLGLLFFYAYDNMPALVPFPFFETAKKIYLYSIPITQLLFNILNLVLADLFLDRRKYDYHKTILLFSIVENSILWVVGFKIVAGLTFFPYNVIDASFLSILPPFFTAFFISLLLTKPTIKLAKRFGIITDPRKDSHPAMLIQNPVPRAGALPFFAGFMLTALIFLPSGSKKLLGIYLGAFLMTILGVLDDKFKDINRLVRIALMLGISLLTSLFGVITFYLNNPFGESFKLDSVFLKFSAFGTEHKIFIFAVLFATIWMFWVENTISWSNGIDGQFAGVAGIASIVIAILSLRSAHIEGENLNVAILSAISAGAILGLTPYTWYPMKIMWGFGATAVGLVLASTSLLSVSKVAVASIVLLVPFLDALFAIVRRVSRHQLPFFGDREHLHHKLLDIGWNKPQIALFYWVITILLGVAAIVSVDKNTALTIIIYAGIAAFFLITINLVGFKYKKTDKRN